MSTMFCRKECSMTFRQRKMEALRTTEEKLTKLLSEMNEEKKGGESNRLVCETECTMARIRSYSDFMYLLRVKPLQTACYYAAVVMLLLLIAALFCSEWLLAVIFGVLMLIFATAPHNMRIRYFNRNADSMERSYGHIINAEFADDGILLTITKAPLHEGERDENGDAVARRSVVRDDSDAKRISVAYGNIGLAIECSHSFYLFPFDENKKRMETLICDKTQFLCGTPMQMRDMLARKCGKNFKIKTKKG